MFIMNGVNGVGLTPRQPPNLLQTLHRVNDDVLGQRINVMSDNKRQDWISVNDALPQDGRFAIIAVLSATGELARVPVTGRLEQGKWHSVNWGSVNQVEGVTHWLPMSVIYDGC